ncbi:hypothetical protein AB205_0161750, partial [Aquarana catesbeiana]
MKRTILTCQITNFREKEIQINVYLRRGHEMKRPLFAKWDSTDQTSNKPLNDLSIAGDQRDNKVHTLPLLEKGDESRTLLPVEMDVKMTKSWTGMYKCLCSITITPNTDKDDGAVLAVEVEHASLKWPICVYRTLTVYKDAVEKAVLTGMEQIKKEMSEHFQRLSEAEHRVSSMEDELLKTQ